MSVNNNPNIDPSIVPLLIHRQHLVDTGFRVHYDGLLDTTIFNAYLDTTTKQICFQREKGDLCFDFSLTGLPDVNASNATNGDVLVYNGTNWEAQSLSGVLNYARNQQSSRFPDIMSVSSVIDALDKILYPFIKPTFTALSIQGQSNTLELGEYLSGSNGGNETFAWAVTTLANISTTNGYKILDITNSYTIANSILPKTLTSSSQSIPYGIRNTTNGATNVFRIIGKDLENNFFQRDLTLTWRPRIFWGTSPVDIALNSSQILSLPSSPTGGSSLVSGIQNSFTMNGNGQYIWIAMPVSFGKAIEADGSNSRFVVGGLANSFWNLFTVNFTNAQGYTSSYYLYRTSTISFGTSIKIDIV
jgi:hypothetical protein